LFFVHQYQINKTTSDQQNNININKKSTKTTSTKIQREWSVE